MIDQLTGFVKNIEQNSIILCIAQICLKIVVPNSSGIKEQQEVSLFSHLYWNNETGPSLYGFQSALERKLFLLIIEVPKIGPKIGIAVLNKLSPQQIFQGLKAGNTRLFAEINGIGPKKAQHILLYLQEKVSKLSLDAPLFAGTNHKFFEQWQKLNDALETLGYSKQEIAQASTLLAQQTENKEIIFDQLLRSALSILAKNS